MKQYLIVLLTLFALFTLKAQVPQGINYQAIVRDGGGNPITSGSVSLGVTLSNADGGTYSATHTVTPNQFGLVNVVIGSINTTSFAAFDFSAIPVTIALTVNGTSLGTPQPLQSVPYAIHCATADAVTNSETINAENGLTKVGSIISLGGALTSNTYIDMGGNDVVFSNNAIYEIRDGDFWLRNMVDNQNVLTVSSSSYSMTLGTTAQPASFRYLDGNQALGRILTSDASGNASWQAAPTSPWTVSGSDVYYNTGSVAIGTTAPLNVNTALTVVKTVVGADYGGMYIGTTSATGKPFYGFALNGLSRSWFYYDGSTTPNALRYWDGGDRLTIQSTTGNVGIGTTTPVNLLDVEGGVAIGASYSGTSTAPASGLIVQGNVGIGTDALTAGTKLEVVGSTRLAGDLNIDSGTPTMRWRTAAGVQQAYIQHSTNLNIDASVGNLIIGNGNLFIDKTNNRVAIGTNTPANKLDVEGGVAIGATYSGTSAAPANGLIVQGNVGIGATTVPSGAKMLVSGGDLILEDTYPFLYLRSSSTFNDGIYFQHGTTTMASITYWGSTNKLHIGSGTGNTQDMVFDVNNGRFGLGTSSPATSIHFFHSTGGPSSGDGLTIQNQGTNNHRWNLYVQNSNGVFQLYKNEAFRGSFDATSGAYTSTSDRRLKKDFEQLDNVLTEVLKVPVYEYRYKEESSSAKKQIGLVAQDLEKLFPSLVSYDSEIDIYTLDYARIGVLALKAIQEQQLLIEENQKQIKLLQEEINALKRQ